MSVPHVYLVEPAHPYASRGAKALAAGREKLHLSPEDLVSLLAQAVGRTLPSYEALAGGEWVHHGDVLYALEDLTAEPLSCLDGQFDYFQYDVQEMEMTLHLLRTRCRCGIFKAQLL